MLLKRLSFYLALAGVAGAVWLINRMRATPPPPPPVAEPARSPYADSVAASGLIEAARENVRIATVRAGLVQRVLVQVGSKVAVGDALFELDDRETRSRLETARARVAALRAALKVEQVQLADARDQFARVERLEKQNVASEDERARKQFQLNEWEARVARIEADIGAAQAEVRQAETDLGLLTVRAPRDGTILQVNTRAGEHAALAPTEPLMILGDTEKFQVRADVDEQNAPLVRAGQPAVAFLKGDTKDAIPLRFVRIEPFVIPKRSLTGDSVERVDTRVLQIIFELDRPAKPLYVGQQVDVFIQRPVEHAAKTEAQP